MNLKPQSSVNAKSSHVLALGTRAAAGFTRSNPGLPETGAGKNLSEDPVQFHGISQFHPLQHPTTGTEIFSNLCSSQTWTQHFTAHWGYARMTRYSGQLALGFCCCLLARESGHWGLEPPLSPLVIRLGDCPPGPIGKAYALLAVFLHSMSKRYTRKKTGWCPKNNILKNHQSIRNATHLNQR